MKPLRNSYAERSFMLIKFTIIWGLVPLATPFCGSSANIFSDIYCQTVTASRVNRHQYLLVYVACHHTLRFYFKQFIKFVSVLPSRQKNLACVSRRILINPDTSFLPTNRSNKHFKWNCQTINLRFLCALPVHGVPSATHLPTGAVLHGKFCK